MPFLSLTAALLWLVVCAGCGGVSPSPTSPTPVVVATNEPKAVTPTTFTPPLTVTLDHGIAASEVFGIWRGVILITPTAGLVNPPRPETVTTTCGNGRPDISTAGFFGEWVVSCAYDRPGAYRVTTTATLETWSASASVHIIVLQKPQTASPLVPINMGSVAYTSTRWGFFVDAGQVLVPIAEYRWSFGDGESAVTRDPWARHEYMAPGVKVITVTATTRDGRGHGTTRDEIVVSE